MRGLHLRMGVYEMTSRKLGRGTIGLIAMTLTLAVTIVALIAMGRLCITSPRRLVDRYEGNLALDGGGAAVDSRADGAVGAKGTRAFDANLDGIPDNDDVLASALAYVQTCPHYKSVYYTSGYPDDEFGVCTDVVARACRAAGYDLQPLMEADITMRPEAYAIEEPDSAIDFRRTCNLEVFFDGHAQSLTVDASKLNEWRGGDIVLYEGHIGVVSDRRNERGVPYLIHHSSPFQLRYEEDRLQSYGRIVGHYRLDPACLALLS